MSKINLTMILGTIVTSLGILIIVAGYSFYFNNVESSLLNNLASRITSLALGIALMLSGIAITFKGSLIKSYKDISNRKD